ncbi:Isocitrate dehydrogenase [NADP] [Capsicum annuum]|uniref:Isocitrate dehydrogenase [NADP] n=1 Tax=Capsicum annuum TaxID=4072 RepID=A0A2G2Y7W9_CAPAN|nr:Isocitrate dehydrogenase [NADP] [Capsicum annuum]
MPKRDLHVDSLDSSTIDINNKTEAIEDLFLDVFYRDTKRDIDALDDWSLDKAPFIEDKSNKGDFGGFVLDDLFIENENKVFATSLNSEEVNCNEDKLVKTRNKKDMEAGAVKLFMYFQLSRRTLRKLEDLVLANEKEKHNEVGANQWELVIKSLGQKHKYSENGFNFGEAGDEMTHVIWKLINDKLIFPFVELDIKYFDLGLPHHDTTDNKVTIKSTKATLKYNVVIKCATITPDEACMKEFNLKYMWKIPNGSIRNILNGDGKLKLVFVPEGTDQKIKFEVYNFTGAGGVALSMYKTDESIRTFAEASMNMAYQKKWPLYLSTNNTILKKYDGRFKDIFKEVYESNWKLKFEAGI